MFSSLISQFAFQPVLAAADAHGGGESHGVSAKALPLFTEEGWGSFLTNSVFVAIIVCLIIVWFVRGAMKNPQLVPGKKQNFIELIVEFLYGQVESIVGPKVAPKAFPLLATIFVFVTVSNWFGLLPGVGTIGFSEHIEGVMRNSPHIERPLLRPATADMNMTVGIALCALVAWFVVTIREVGFKGFIAHMFSPPSMIKGGLRWGLFLIFLMVGLIEVISILFRPMTLSLRLYGNVFAGENLLHTMAVLGNQFTSSDALRFLFSVALPIPFYFLEILVGVLQGMVFALLCTVFVKLSTTHDDHGEEHGHDHGHGHEASSSGH